MPQLSIVFNQSEYEYETSVFAVDIFPEIYLFADGDNTCMSLIRQVNNDQETGFILGSPFFRNFTLDFNYI